MRRTTILIGIVFILFACSNGHVYEEAPFNGSKVIIDANMLKEGVPVFYTLRHNGRHINYIVMKTDNDIQSYFDACAECYPEKKGFRHEDGSLVCNLCNVGYSLHTFKEGKGSCYPFKLEGILKDNVYEIDKDTIIKGKRYF